MTADNKTYWTMTRTEFKLGSQGTWDCQLTFRSSTGGRSNTFKIGMHQLFTNFSRSTTDYLQATVGSAFLFELRVHNRIAIQIQNIKNEMEKGTIINSQWRRYMDTAKADVKTIGYEGPISKLLDCFPIDTGAGYMYVDTRMQSNKYLPYLSAFLECHLSPRFKPELVTFSKKVDDFNVDTFKFEELLNKQKNRVITDELRIQELFDGHKVKYSKFLTRNHELMKRIHAFGQLTSNFGLTETMSEVETVLYAFLDNKFKKET